MIRAYWNDAVIAESDTTIKIEGNHYFPPETVRQEMLSDSDTQSTCPWKGDAKYYHINVNGSDNKDAAWSYPDPKDAAAEIKDYVAFWNGVEVREE